MGQLCVIAPRFAILDETDSGLDIDALRTVGEGINRIMRAPDKAVLLITHYERLLEIVAPDFVHVLAGGRIVRSGGIELARQLGRGLCAGGGVTVTGLLELPSRREEAWRWSRLDALPELAHARHGEAGNAAQHFIGLGGPRLVFVDGVLDEDASELGRVSIGALDLATDHPLGRQATGAGWALTLDRDQDRKSTRLNSSH